MKQIIFALLFTVPSLSWADWEPLGFGDDFSEYYFERASINKKGSIAKMWVMNSYPSPQTQSNIQYLSTTNYIVVDCQSKSLKVTTINFYSEKRGKGTVVSNVSVKENQADFVPVVPQSFGDRQVKIACGKAKRWEDFLTKDTNG